MTDYVLTGLVKKRAELAGELQRLHEAMGSTTQALEHLDATIKLIAPDYQPEGIAPKLFRPPEDWSKRGQMSRMVLSILRVAKEPMTTREIATQMILQRGLAMDRKLLLLMSKRVGAALRDQREKGRAVSDGAGEMYQTWEIVRAEK
jgi:hypothetical protein